MKNPYREARRLQVLRITPELITSFCRGRYEIVDNFVPDGATVLQTNFDEYDQCIEILIEHGSFPEVGPGVGVPEVPPIRVNRIYREDVGNQIAESAAATLNDALDADPACISALFCVTRTCNEALADHPSVIVRERDVPEGKPYCSLSFLGLLNGILIESGSKKRVAKVVDDENNQNVLRFEVRDESEFKE